MPRINEVFAIDDFIDKFEELKLKLENSRDPDEKKILIKEMKLTANDIPHLAGWPGSSVFWSEDAYVWKTARVEKEIREFIKKSLNQEISKNNLDIGCGSFSYFPGIDFDFSFRMLKENESKNPKVMGNALTLPFKDASFDSVTIIFVCNYLENLFEVFKNIKIILKKGGTLHIIQSVVDVPSIHSIVQKHPAKGFEKKLITLLKEAGFEVKISKKDYKKKSFWLVQASVNSARFDG